MKTAKNYMGTKIAEIVDWSAVFSAGILGEEAKLGLTAAQSAEFKTVNLALQAANAVANNPATKTKVTTDQRLIAIDNMKAVARTLVGIIQVTPGVSTDTKLALGLTIRDVHPSPRPTPVTAPRTEVVGVLGREVMYRVSAMDSTRRGRPEGTAGCIVFTFVGPHAPADLKDYAFFGQVTKSSFNVPYPADLTPGSTVYMICYWYTATGKTGPASQPIGVTFGAAGVGMPKAA